MCFVLQSRRERGYTRSKSQLIWQRCAVSVQGTTSRYPSDTVSFKDAYITYTHACNTFCNHNQYCCCFASDSSIAICLFLPGTRPYTFCKPHAVIYLCPWCLSVPLHPPLPSQAPTRTQLQANPSLIDLIQQKITRCRQFVWRDFCLVATSAATSSRAGTSATFAAVAAGRVIAGKKYK